MSQKTLYLYFFVNFYLFIVNFEVFPKKSVFWSWLFIGLSSPLKPQTAGRKAKLTGNNYLPVFESIGDIDIISCDLMSRCQSHSLDAPWPNLREAHGQALHEGASRSRKSMCAHNLAVYRDWCRALRRYLRRLLASD